jgi:hypothetical protein
MTLTRSSDDYVFHVYVQRINRIACGKKSGLLAVIADGWVHHLDEHTACADCLRILTQIPVEDLGPETAADFELAGAVM